MPTTNVSSTLSLGPLTPLPVLLPPFEDVHATPVPLTVHQLAFFLFWCGCIVLYALVRGGSLLSWLCLPAASTSSSSSSSSAVSGGGSGDRGDLQAGGGGGGGEHASRDVEGQGGGDKERKSVRAFIAKRKNPFTTALVSGKDLAELRVLLQSLVAFGAIMLYFYICDVVSYWPAANRSYNRDVYATIIVVAFLVSAATIKTVGGLSTNEKIRAAAEAATKAKHQQHQQHQQQPELLVASPASASTAEQPTKPSAAPASLASSAPGKPVILNRDQSDEWKGWMQMAFVLYHFYRAGEVYNEIRVFVAAYVFLTGFGNFSYFWTKKDFSLFRVAKMLFRLNFLVLMVMVVTNNRYILYYICPMHTFWFLTIYACMFLFKSLYLNRLAMLGMFGGLLVVSYLLWEWPLAASTNGAASDGNRSADAVIGNAVFSIFSFLLSDTDGTVREWMTRSGLDHFVAILGMIFAYFHPNMQRALTWLEELPFVKEAPPAQSDDEEHDSKSARTRQALAALGVPGHVLGCLLSFFSLFLDSSTVLRFVQRATFRTFWIKLGLKLAIAGAGLGLLLSWYSIWGVRQKLAYTQDHAYVAILAIVGFLVIRNIFRPLRKRFIGMFAFLGSITLETYIAQFHILMQANAKKIIVYLPGYPLLNFVLAVCIYLLASYWLFRLTVALSTLLLPEEAGKPEGSAARESMLHRWLGILCGLSVCYLLSIFALHGQKR